MTDATDPVTQLSSVELHVTMARIHSYADIVDDYNPIHVDPAFAERSPMGGIIAHGTMSLALVWQALEQSFDATKLRGVDLEIRFTKPVRLDDVLNSGGTRNDQSDSLEYDVWVENQRGERVLSGSARFS